ncbi:MAG: recombinase family protein [Hyphomicrobiaceae bacterium]|nr:recombinase family protein [Hyphomicrobiaceae bacterium]
MNIVTYKRVSTREQGQSGLGLDGQENTIQRHVERTGNNVVGAFVEVESGRKDSRVQLKKAIALCKKTSSTLLIAKLDRLSRSVSFTSALMESGVEFIALDMPTASKLNIHILSAISEHEADTVSSKTKTALAALKRRNVKLGFAADRTDQAECARKSAQVRGSRVDDWSESLRSTIEGLQAAGANTTVKLATALNVMEKTTRRGCEFKPTTVNRLLKRLARAS